jgi:transcriptional regulator with XRE-family HTH domain
MKKQKPEKTSLPPLCAAVRRTRSAYAESQPAFARRIGVAAMTISRFENAKQVPADFQVLAQLERAARERGLTEEADLLAHAARGARRGREEDAIAPAGGELAPMPIHTWAQWRLMHAAGIAVLHYPEVARAMEQAGGAALSLVDEALGRHARMIKSGGLGVFSQAVRELMVLVAQRDLEAFSQHELETKSKR